ncbi:MAG TPA: hypothetical protein VFR81_14535 [Longimicrobium sp.]|nr:hypothetical protein [Longimicrobium sp.]
MDRKLTLDMDTITVSTFTMAEKQANLRGTVQAREDGPGCPWSQPLSCVATSHSCTD